MSSPTSPTTGAPASVRKKDIFLFIKMKTILLVLTLGIVGVISKPTEKLPLETSSKSSVSETTEAIVSVLIEDTKKTEPVVAEINEILIEDDTQSSYATTLDRFMEERLNSPDVLDQGTVPDIVSDLSEDNEEILYNDVLNKDPAEIMDTAAGFLPVPIIKHRQRQSAKRRYATRRNFRRNPYPYRRLFYFYPSYGFYPQSSLRYY